MLPRHFVPRSLFSRAFRVGLVATAITVPTLAFAASKPVVEVAFVLDTTGSMADLIDGAKRKIWSIATTIADQNPDADVKMALVAYRDIGDDYVTKTYDLTTDIQDIYSKLLALNADGGNDWPESVNEALDVSVTKLKWGQGAKDTRIIFLIGDAPPHMDYEQDRKYPVIVKEAEKRGIIVNAVQAGGAEDTTRVWRAVAQLGKGEFIPIPQDGGKVLVIITPYDDEIIKLQLRIDETVIPYGTRAAQDTVNKKLAERKSAPAASSADNSSYLSKRSKGKDVVTGSGDLVSDSNEGRVDLGTLKDEELPKNLRAMPRGERSKEILRLTEARNALAINMADLVKKRDGFVADKRAAAPKTADSFDSVVERTLKAQVQR